MADDDWAAATAEQWLAFVEAVADGHVSIMEVMKANRSEPGDYFGHVQSSRVSMMLLRDERILKRLAIEIGASIDRISAGKHSADLNASVASKDGLRRLLKITKLHVEMADNSPSLLTGSTFEECLQQYLKVLGHLEQLWTDSRDLYRGGHFPLATFTSILLLEEMGKVGLIWHELLAYDSPRSAATELRDVGRNHRQKAFMGVMAGALINARLDRIVGLNAVRQVIQDAESGRLETLRQACLYIDYVDGAVATPGERIGQEKAKLLVLLAGEIWAEAYGHFPFEFERMIGTVSAFEAELG
ncbi:AbiV family abortive infection protein [Acidisphaera sp. L21]|uniref:AbiV family abortive infection protein n=1 Tax=Acidisphaera sp. L21 TaxID=1641851 RepID=UPI00131BE19D|nr:AbiV family abortive infection protein [Acidisphaera sp. L21]